MESLLENQIVGSAENYGNDLLGKTTLLTFLSVNLVTIVVFLFAGIYHAKFWQRQGMPAPPSKPFFGNLPVFPLGNFEAELMALIKQLRKWAESLGPSYGFQHGWRNVFVTSDPVALKEIFVTKTDSFEILKYPMASSPYTTDPAEFRASVLSAVNGRNLKLLITTMNSACKGMVKAIKCSLGDSTSKVMDLRESIHEVAWQMIVRMRLGECGEYKPDDQEVEELVPLAKKIYAENRLETIADLITMVMHVLMLNPDVLKKIRAEVQQVVGDGEVAYEKLNQLKLLEATIQEILRLYPIAVINTDRVTREEVVLAGHKIPKGVIVKPNIQSSHLHNEVWGPDAVEFRPERWLETGSKSLEAVKSQELLAWFPFGAGRTICPGARFVMAFTKIGLVHLLREFDFEMSEKKKPIELKMMDEATYSSHFRGLYMYPEGATAKVSLVH